MGPNLPCMIEIHRENPALRHTCDWIGRGSKFLLSFGLFCYLLYIHLCMTFCSFSSLCNFNWINIHVFCLKCFDQWNHDKGLEMAGRRNCWQLQKRIVFLRKSTIWRRIIGSFGWKFIIRKKKHDHNLLTIF